MRERLSWPCHIDFAQPNLWTSLAKLMGTQHDVTLSSSMMRESLSSVCDFLSPPRSPHRKMKESGLKDTARKLIKPAIYNWSSYANHTHLQNTFTHIVTVRPFCFSTCLHFSFLRFDRLYIFAFWPFHIFVFWPFSHFCVFTSLRFEFFHIFALLLLMLLLLLLLLILLLLLL